MLIRLIGPVTTHINGNVHRFTAPKMACVLAALAVRPGEPIETTELASRVWGTEPPETAISVLYSYIARLRSVLRGTDRVRIRRSRSGYTLDIDPDDVDLHRFRRLITQADKQAKRGDTATALRSWRTAEALATGEALVGIEGRWAQSQRAGFRREHLELLTSRYGAELALGHHDTVIDELTEAVSRHPLTEPLVEHLMLAQYRCGRAAEALESFETTKRRLWESLGAHPSPTLRRLHRLILNQDPQLSPQDTVDTAATPHPTRPVPAQLPADTVGFVGRTAEVAELRAASATRRVITVDGMAGVGKTAFVLYTAHRLASRFPDGQLFLDLHGYTQDVRPVSPAKALAHLLRSLGENVPDSTMERAAALRMALTGRRMLLVLDNATDAKQLRPLLPDGTHCLTVVTSRRRLTDVVDAAHISLDVLPAALSTKVFTTEAGLSEGGRVVDEITTACGHLPLALRIAASRLRHRPSWKAEDLLTRLKTGGLRELDAGGRGVASAFEPSYRKLDGDAQKVFRLLGLHPDTDIDRHDIATLAGIGIRDADAALEQLLDGHLLRTSSPGRYRMHILLRHLAESLITAAERDTALQRLADRPTGSAPADEDREVAPADHHGDAGTAMNEETAC